jgi:serine/threonine protein kinase
VVQVLAHVAMRLKDLHSGGHCHRDIKPGNIMLLHRNNRWTLIDFGSVAPIGKLAGLSFTLHYAAPEAVEAWKSGACRPAFGSGEHEHASCHGTRLRLL